jgi:hypothetical protein
VRLINWLKRRTFKAENTAGILQCLDNEWRDVSRLTLPRSVCLRARERLPRISDYDARLPRKKLGPISSFDQDGLWNSNRHNSAEVEYSARRRLSSHERQDGRIESREVV